MKKVKTDSYGLVHAVANCDHCDFHEGSYIDVSRMRVLARRHVAKTGHTVNVETGKSTTYSPDI